jgi:hypothetical protein
MRSRGVGSGADVPDAEFLDDGHPVVEQCEVGDGVCHHLEQNLSIGCPVGGDQGGLAV